jgi:transposase
MIIGGERQWRHLDTMQFQTILHCRIPRVKCTDHGVKSIEVPWAEKNSRFTALFERLAMDVLLGCQNQTKGKELLKLSWDEVHLIHEKAVQKGLQRRVGSGVQYLGADERCPR